MGKKHDDSLGDIDYDKFHKRLTRTVFIVHEIMQDSLLRRLLMSFMII